MKTTALLLAAFLLAPIHAGSMCEGREGSPETRMGCCTPHCDMHHAAPEPAATVSQAQADSCCAMSAPDDARLPQPAAAATAPAASPVRIDGVHAVVITASHPLPAVWRAADIRPPGRVPTHVLLSVFLV